MTKRTNHLRISTAPLSALLWFAITGCASGPPPEPTPLPVSGEADSTLRVPCEAATVITPNARIRNDFIVPSLLRRHQMLSPTWNPDDSWSDKLRVELPTL